jgi:hypothetical protein
MSKVVRWLVIIVIVVWVASNPVHAGDAVNQWFHAADTFFHHLTNS